jgi:hypothetical protein
MLHSSGGALGFSAAPRSILWNQIFASDPWKYRKVGAVQDDERFHPREIQSSSAQRQHPLRTKERAQRRCRALSPWPGIRGNEKPNIPGAAIAAFTTKLKVEGG